MYLHATYDMFIMQLVKTKGSIEYVASTKACSSFCKQFLHIKRVIFHAFI